MENQTAFDCFCIVEVFGHQKLAGRVSERVIAGKGFVQIDVPQVNGQPAFTRLYGPDAIYSITPVSEELALRAAESLRERPVTVYIPALPAGRPAPAGEEEEDEDPDREEYE